jgi:peptidyl-prolyl cis-trans isomerase C
MKNTVALVALGVSLLSPLLALADDRVVLKADDFTVTVDDLNQYLTAQDISEERREEVLSQEGAVRALFENIYVIRALSQRGAANDAIDLQEIEWQARHHRDRLLMNRQLELEVDSEIAKIDWDPLVKEHYLANKKEYVVQEKVDADHILLSTRERSEEEALAKAKAALDRLKSGEDFGLLARELSDDEGSGARGGKLGAFGRGAMVPSFEEAVFALREPGELSDPVKSRFGYHIIKLNKYVPEKQLSLEEATTRIRPKVQSQLRQEIRQSKINAIKTGEIDLGLEVNAALLETIEKQYAAPTDALK